jgi:hypothetical protein
MYFKDHFDLELFLKGFPRQGRNICHPTSPGQIPAWVTTTPGFSEIFDSVNRQNLYQIQFESFHHIYPLTYWHYTPNLTCSAEYFLQSLTLFTRSPKPSILTIQKYFV